jgi:hypothetical protein
MKPRSVMECASPLALWRERAIGNNRRSATGAAWAFTYEIKSASAFAVRLGGVTSLLSNLPLSVRQ